MRQGLTEEGAFKQNLEARRGRGSLVLQKDHSGQKEEQVKTQRWGHVQGTEKRLMRLHASEGGLEQGRRLRSRGALKAIQSHGLSL